MADERHYIVRLTDVGFDATTASTTSDPWLPAPQAQTNQKYRSLSLAAARGRFPSALLGKTSKSISLVRVFTDGAVQPNDQYGVVGSATTVAADGTVQADPPLARRSDAVKLGTTLASALPLELGATDELIILTERACTAHIVVYDLDEREAFDWVLRVQEVAERWPVRTRVQAASGTLAVWDGILYVAATAAAAGDTLTLPVFTTIAEGDKVTIFRDGGSWFNVDGNGTDPINGDVFPVRFVADGMGVTFERTAVGWSATAAANSTTLVALTDTQAIPVPTRKRTHVQWTLTGSANLTLPAIASVPIDAEITVDVVSIAAGTRFAVVPTGGEAVDSVANKATTFIRPGDAAVFRRIDGGWLSLHNGCEIDQSIVNVVADPALGASGGWVGERAYSCTYAGAASFTLPTAPKTGTCVTLWQTNANAVTADAGANTIAAAGTAAATKTLTINVPLRLKFFGVGGVGTWLGT